MEKLQDFNPQWFHNGYRHPRGQDNCYYYPATYHATTVVPNAFQGTWFQQWGNLAPVLNHQAAAHLQGRTNGTSTGNKNEGEKEIEDPWGMVEAQAAFLGPSLWDNSDFKPRVSPTDLTKKLMEYMDLDEFLSENGIPLEETSANPSPPTSPPTSAPASKANETNQNRSRTSATTNKPASSVELLNAELLSSESSSSSSSCRSMLNSVPPAVVSASRAASAPAAKRKGRPPAIRQPLRDDDEDEEDDDDDDEEDNSDDEEPVPRKTARRGDDLALATLPGESFDPRARCFSEEELRPQPMVKKSKKQYVPDDLKDEKYWSRRQKNNIAAKRSRDARRMKENQIIMRASFLEKENTTLKAQLEKSKKENAALRQRLQKYERV